MSCGLIVLCFVFCVYFCTNTYVFALCVCVFVCFGKYNTELKKKSLCLQLLNYYMM